MAGDTSHTVKAKDMLGETYKVYKISITWQIISQWMDKQKYKWKM